MGISVMAEIGGEFAFAVWVPPRARAMRAAVAVWGDRVSVFWERPGAVAGAVRARLAGLPGLIRRHALFSAALGLSAVPRLIAMLGFQPAMLFKMDSYDYLWGATHLAPNPINPSGYSLLLWLLLPAHSLILVAALQHLLGMGIAVMAYGTLRHWNVRAWIATLAVAPVLFGPAQLLMEQEIMADLLAMALLVAAFTVLLMRRQPSAWRVAAAGLLMGASVTVRPTALPLIVLMGAYLLVRRAGWVKAGAVLVGGALPVVAYMGWFYAASGSFALTNSDGLFLWSRTMSFANCAVIKPSASLRALCPDVQPGRLAEPDPAKRDQPKWYLWTHGTWEWPKKPSGIVPDSAAFTAANNSRARAFAIRAIEAQPTAYLRAVEKGTAKAFTTNDHQFIFPGSSAYTSGLTSQNARYAIAALRSYVGNPGAVAGDLGGHTGEQVVRPYAHLIRVYQGTIFLPGPVFGLIVLAGLAGMIIPRTRSSPAALLWISAVVTIVLPVAEHEYNYRYVAPAIPLACMAVALVRASRPAKAAGSGDAASAVGSAADRAEGAVAGEARM